MRTYDAYGQSLELERGELLFTGPLDDPTIDVRAVRRVGATTVGVQLTGTLLAPSTRVYSEPPMSEADALAYLLLGRPLSGSGGLLVRLRFNERLSIETRPGDEKSMDLLYTVEKE